MSAPVVPPLPTQLPLNALDSDVPATLNVQFFDKENQPDTPENAVNWASNDPTIVSIGVVSVDGLSASLIYGLPGSATVTATTTNNDGTVAVAKIPVIIGAGEPAAGVITATVPSAAPAVPATNVAAPSTSSAAPAASTPAPTDTTTGTAATS